MQLLAAGDRDVALAVNALLDELLGDRTSIRLLAPRVVGACVLQVGWFCDTGSVQWASPRDLYATPQVASTLVS
ncbi:MAG TPA: hypothetical protein VFN67_38155 [Polyangiales bacterium]|nr:hypothetical protein [Polyangiales bacterium]